MNALTGRLSSNYKNTTHISWNRGYFLDGSVKSVQSYLLPLLLVFLILFNLLVDNIRHYKLSVYPTHVQELWKTKPVLGYFALTHSLGDVMQAEVGFSKNQMNILKQISRLEVEQLQAIELESLDYIGNPNLSLEQKRALILEMGYNQRVSEITATSQEHLRIVLGGSAYQKLSTWMEERWVIEHLRHGVSALASQSRTFEIYATRYDSKGAYYVALPDQCVKFTNGGNSICEKYGYKVGGKYDVYVSYKKGVAARVGESGPWNVDDNYWSTLQDPTPRRMFADLSLGMPEAQAAYFNGYNGGLDQYGRVVTAPYGIDLARQVSIDIGLEPGTNDWINVAFLWTEGWDDTVAAAAPTSETIAEATPQPTEAPAAPVSAKAATPQADGSWVHVVQAEQTLWEIAAIYEISLDELLDLNDMTKDSFIRPGDKLIVIEADESLILTRTANAMLPTATRRPTRTPTMRPATETPDGEPAQESTRTVAATENGSGETNSPFGFLSGINPLLIGIAFFVAAGMLLMVVGAYLNRKE